MLVHCIVPIPDLYMHHFFGNSEQWECLLWIVLMLLNSFVNKYGFIPPKCSSLQVVDYDPLLRRKLRDLGVLVTFPYHTLSGSEAVCCVPGVMAIECMYVRIRAWENTHLKHTHFLMHTFISHSFWHTLQLLEIIMGCMLMTACCHAAWAVRTINHSDNQHSILLQL